MRTISYLACALALLLLPSMTTASPQAQDAASAPKTTINLNTATVDQLMSLPGIGQKTAALIIEYRTRSGGFKKIEELMNVKGIGEKSFLKIRPLVSASPKPDKAPGD